MDKKWYGITLIWLSSLLLISCAIQDTTPISSNSDVTVTVGAGKDEALSAYIKEVMKLASKNIKYPRRSIHLGEHGMVMLSVEMNRDGSNHKCSIWSSSRSPILDKEALFSCSKTTFPPLSSELLERIPPDQERVGITYHVKFIMRRSKGGHYRQGL